MRQPSRGCLGIFNCTLAGKTFIVSGEDSPFFDSDPRPALLFAKLAPRGTLTSAETWVWEARVILLWDVTGVSSNCLHLFVTLP